MEAVKGLFGGNKDAKKQAEQSAQLQRIGNDRQLAEQNRNSAAVGASRKAPRGRRLFEEGSASGSTVLA